LNSTEEQVNEAKSKDLNELIESKTTELDELIESKAAELDEFIKSDIKAKSKDLNELIESKTTELDSLTTSINNLLPSALSAGLASSYRIQKESYNQKIRSTNHLIIIAFFLLLILAISNFIFISIYETTMESFFKRILPQITVILTLVWFIIYSISNVNKLTRLQQEYSHKETLLSSYSNFKIQIEDVDTDPENALLKNLISLSLDAASFNPATILDKHEKTETPIDSMADAAKKVVDSIKGRS